MTFARPCEALGRRLSPDAGTLSFRNVQDTTRGCAFLHSCSMVAGPQIQDPLCTVSFGGPSNLFSVLGFRVQPSHAIVVERCSQLCEGFCVSLMNRCPKPFLLETADRNHGLLSAASSLQTTIVDFLLCKAELAN